MTKLLSVGVALAITSLGVVACELGSVPEGLKVDVEEGPCGRAMFVVAIDQDYASTSVSVVGWDGEVKSAGMLSSGSETSGLSVTLSGDVVAPTERFGLGKILLIDRYPASVLTVLDPARAKVESQINVQTGNYPLNPRDALLAREGTLYVSRYNRNPDAGQQPFDEGSDVLVVDLSTGEPIGRVDLTTAMAGAPSGFLPRPDRMVLRGGLVYVLLGVYSTDFKSTHDARIAVVDPARDEVVGSFVLDGARGCSGLAASADGARIAVSCSGNFGGSSKPDTTGAGVFVLDRAADGSLSEKLRLPASSFGDEPLSFSLAFGSNDVVIASTFGALDELTGETQRDDRLVEIDLATTSVRELLRSTGEPFTIGDIRCGEACGVCFVADAGLGGLQMLSLDETGHVKSAELVPVDDGTGLPPRYIGAY
jgi:hypothetical protein